MKRKSISFSLFYVLISLSFLGCGQSFNSNTEDFNLTAFSYCSDASDTRLCEANEIIQTNCTNCHTSSIHASWSGYDTNQEWVDSGRIIAGDADRSVLVTRLKNYGGNMPEGAPPLDQADAEKIRTWVNSLN